MFMGMAAVASGLGRVRGHVLPIIMGMGMSVIARMFTMRCPPLQNIQNPNPRCAGGVERNDKNEQESEQETHGAHYSRGYNAAPAGRRPGNQRLMGL